MSKKEANQYDKIFKENLRSFLINFAQSFLGIQIQEGEALDPGLQTTIERQPDFLHLIKNKGQASYILHIEFQSEDDSEMVYRMAEYKAILLRKYRLEVIQYVIYLGSGASKMKTQLPSRQQIKGFELRNLSEINYKKLLSASDPETVIMAILSNFQKRSPELVVDQILLRLQQLGPSPSALKKYHTQLNVLSKLRKLDELTLKKINDMPIIIDFEDHILFKKGVLQGREKERIIMIENLILMDRNTIEEIAQITNTSIEFAQSIQKRLEASSEEE